MAEKTESVQAEPRPTFQFESRPTFDDLMKIEAVRNISCWKLPNSDDRNDPDGSVKFGHEHRDGFFRFARAAVGLIKSKSE